MAKRMTEEEKLRLEHLLGMKGKRFTDKLGVARKLLEESKDELDPEKVATEDRFPRSLRIIDALIECVDALDARLEAVEREVLPGESFIRGDDIPHKISTD